ncbi:MAG: efflux RND transporter periplasmic adaptor subunit [Candidatus Pacebacteria bacterium]|nr:efflux RND transporter periplasmic adaptor subunit [Candidatus Paceibacterota bacterium]
MLYIFRKISNLILKHKFIAAVITAIILTALYFSYTFIFRKNNEVNYVTAEVEKGTLIVSVSGTGQVSALDQVDIKSKTSGEIVYVGVKKGQEVKASALIAAVDAYSAEKAVRDAEINLETANLELEKLLSPPDQLTLLQYENSLIQAKESKAKAENNLEESYDEGFNDISNAFLELPAIMAGLQDMLFSYSFSTNQQNIDYYVDAVKNYDNRALGYRDSAYSKYQTARKSYDQNFQDYKSASRFLDKSEIESLINETYETIKNISEALKSANNLIQFYQDKLIEHSSKPQNLSSTHLLSLAGYISKTNSQLSSILSVQSSIKNNKESVTSTERTIQEKELSLAKLKLGADDLDIRAKKIVIQQKEDALLDAKQSLADCYIRAPFDGIIASIDVKKGDSVSSGAVATIITKKKIAEITLNEVDIAKVKEGQRANITFDVIEDLNITGEVAEIDSLGAVSQGVVSYSVKIIFDTQDERVKPGMSVSAVIITDMKQDILMVSNSAVKSNGGQYVVVLENNMPYNQVVETGLSNDTMIEIASGLEEGDKVVTQTISSGTKTVERTANTGGGGIRTIMGGPGM